MISTCWTQAEMMSSRNLWWVPVSKFSLLWYWSAITGLSFMPFCIALGKCAVCYWQTLQPSWTLILEDPPAGTPEQISTRAMAGWDHGPGDLPEAARDTDIDMAQSKSYSATMQLDPSAWLSSIMRSVHLVWDFQVVELTNLVTAEISIC